jgi:hypothetical protein
MNGTAQRQRHTAVRTADKRIEDIEAVVEGLAQQSSTTGTSGTARSANSSTA